MTEEAAERSPAERLATVARALKSARERLLSGERLRPAGEGLPRAAEWLLDNGYIVQAALAQV